MMVAWTPGGPQGGFLWGVWPREALFQSVPIRTPTSGCLPPPAICQDYWESGAGSLVPDWSFSKQPITS